MIRLGIVGSGFGSTVHLPAFAAMDEVQVVSIADSGSGGAAKYGDQRIVYFSDWQTMIDSGDLDALSVTTPPEHHKEIVCAALDAGLHVLCEKPFGLDAGDAQFMCRKRNDAGLVGTIDFQFRFEPGISEMRHLVADGVIGRLETIGVTWLTSGRSDAGIPWSWQNDKAAGGGVINGFFSHVVDFIAWIAGEPIASAIGRTKVVVARRRDSDGRECKVTAEDHVEARFLLKSNASALATVSNCHTQNLGLAIHVRGSHGDLTFQHRPPFDEENASLRLRSDTGDVRAIPIRNPGVSVPGDSRLVAFHILARHFIDAIRGNASDLLPRFEDGATMHRVLDALRRSNSGGTEIPVAPRPAESRPVCP